MQDIWPKSNIFQGKLPKFYLQSQFSMSKLDGIFTIIKISNFNLSDILFPADYAQPLAYAPVTQYVLIKLIVDH